ncbi:MAG: DUF4282 domain-containing protein [Acidimicrobiales bacterium]
MIVILLSLGALGAFIAGLATGRAGGIFFALIIVPILSLVYLIMARIWMEFLIVVFRIGDDIRAIRIGGGSGGFPTPGPMPPPLPR